MQNYMRQTSPDLMLSDDNWSDLSQYQQKPDINSERLQAYRMGRIKACMREADVALCVLVNPISLRYVVEYRNYSLFQSHIPTIYLFLPVEGPVVIHGGYDPSPSVKDIRPGRPISFFAGGYGLVEGATLLASDIVDFLNKIGTDNRRVAVEYVNPSITQALERAGLEVVDGVAITEAARLIKSADEIACMKWSIAVAEHGLGKMKAAIKPGVSELQLWGLVNYTNLANNGDWHDGRMLASGPRINPWCQEASERLVESGDLVGIDTDMIGPYGYSADISRTFHCGPGKPGKRQKQLYRLAMEEVEYNTGLIRPGISFSEFQQQAYQVSEVFHHNAYSCIIHGIGMCDEYPSLKPQFRGALQFEGKLEAGMVVCVESYMGAVGEREGVKLEQQVLVTGDGHEMLTSFPLEDALLD
jgi:Xaa-Pro dipeptidase